MPEIPDPSHLLVLPRLRVQNANAVSSPMTWGFPSITAFLGLMWALERKVSSTHSIIFYGVGVVCHGFEPQVTSGGFTRAFHLTRNPIGMKKNIDKEGNIKQSDGIVEEGRAHLDLTLIFDVVLGATVESSDERDHIAQSIADTVATMRIAGGIIIPAPRAYKYPPEIIPLEQDHDKRRAQFRGLRRRWLPGFSLVSRDDLLQQRMLEMQVENPAATALDAWLDCSRLNWRAFQQPEDAEGGSEKAEWRHSRTEGWIVPVPVGYGAISELHPPGAVANARDDTTPFQFVEAVYSLGQWIGPHRLNDARQLLWYAQYDAEHGLYRCCNGYRADTTPFAN